MIVVDVNVIAYLLIEGEFTKQAQNTFAKDSHWVVPSLWRHEFVNIVSKYLQTGGVNINEAKEIWANAVILFEPNEQQVNFEEVLMISVENNISAYDGQYIALARNLNAPLITEDKQLLSKFPSKASSMNDFCKRAN